MSIDKQQNVAWLEIDLEKLRQNIMLIRNRVGGERKIMAVVKANAYGLGMNEISTFLLGNGVDEIAVANITEGIALRSAGIQAPILALGVTLPEHAHLFVTHSITATVCSLDVVQALNERGEIEKRKIKVHVRVDLGLGSVGLLPGDCVSFILKMKDYKWVEVEGIFTQLASAYEEDLDELWKDLHLFKRILYELKNQGIEIPIVHLASSAAILTLPETYFDLVRPGIMTYGLPALKHYRDEQLKPIMALKAKVVVVKELEAGSFIGGYGNRRTLAKKTVIATIPVGYGDGLFLFYLKNGEVIINGKRASFIGRPFMDYLMVDVTHIPNVKIGDEVVIFGNQGEESISIEEIAEKINIGVMNCDCITLMNNRIPRIYVSDQMDDRQTMGALNHVAK